MKRNKFSKILIMVMLLALCLPIVAIGVSATGADTAVFTRVDMSAPVYSKGQPTAWKIGADGIISQTSLNTSAIGESIAMSDTYLEKGKAYTIEAKVRFSDAFTNASNNSRAIGIVFGSNNQAPWDNGGSAYCAMIDRASGTGKHIRVFAKNITSNVQNNIGRAFTATEKATTDWFTIRVTVSEAGNITCYLNGTIVGVASNESANWNGGYIGINTYGVRTKVEIKDFAVAPCVTTATAVYADSIAEKAPVTIKYVYAGSEQKAADDVVVNVAEGEMYSVASPSITGIVPSHAVVSGVGTGSPETITVTYQSGYKLTIKYVFTDGRTVFEDYVQENMLPGETYSVQTYPIANYTADTEVVAGTMGNEDKIITVTFAPKTYKLTIKYVDESGEEVHDAYVENIVFDAEYKVESPVIDGMTADKSEVSGKGIKKDTTVTVTYKTNDTVASNENTEASDTEEKGGCGSMIGFTGAFAIIGIASGACVLARSKKDD